MQYILSEAEFAAMSARADQAVNENKTLIANLCRRVANSEIVELTWVPVAESKPWGCIRDSETEHHCDECPMVKICTFDNKSFSQ